MSAELILFVILLSLLSGGLVVVAQATQQAINMIVGNKMYRPMWWIKLYVGLMAAAIGAIGLLLLLMRSWP